MRLEPVVRMASIQLTCVWCMKKGATLADLDGVPFGAYYHQACADASLEPKLCVCAPPACPECVGGLIGFKETCPTCGGLRVHGLCREHLG